MNRDRACAGCSQPEPAGSPRDDSTLSFRLKTSEAECPAVGPLKLSKVSPDGNAILRSPAMSGLARRDPCWCAPRFLILPNDLKSPIRAVREQNRPVRWTIVHPNHRRGDNVLSSEARD
jgi:hypothetical protein